MRVRRVIRHEHMHLTHDGSSRATDNHRSTYVTVGFQELAGAESTVSAISDFFFSIACILYTLQESTHHDADSDERQHDVRAIRAVDEGALVRVLQTHLHLRVCITFLRKIAIVIRCVNLVEFARTARVLCYSDHGRRSDIPCVNVFRF